MEYGILDNIQIWIQHMNIRRQEISHVHYNWWIEHPLKSHTCTSYSFKYTNFRKCYWGYIPHLFVVLVVQSIVWCTSNEPNPRYIFPGGRSMKTCRIPMYIYPLRFGVNIHKRKHKNSEVLFSNRNKSPMEMSVNSRGQKHREHVNRSYLTECTG